MHLGEELIPGIGNSIFTLNVSKYLDKGGSHS